MTNEEFNQWFKRKGFKTNREAATYLGMVGIRQVQHFKSGDKPVSDRVARLIKRMEKGRGK
jgi:hypothetical protein